MKPVQNVVGCNPTERCSPPADNPPLNPSDYLTKPCSLLLLALICIAVNYYEC